MTHPSPLTHLNDDEKLFFNTVLDFARKEIGPKVSAMDESETMDAGLIKKLFEQGFMGIEVPEKWGGTGGTFFNAILAIQALAQVDPSVSVFVDVQNTLVENAFMKWGTPFLQEKYLTMMCQGKVGSYCLTDRKSVV